MDRTALIAGITRQVGAISESPTTFESGLARLPVAPALKKRIHRFTNWRGVDARLAYLTFLLDTPRVQLRAVYASVPEGADAIENPHRRGGRRIAGPRA